MLRSATTHPQQLAGTTPSLLAVRPSCDESVNVNTTDATTGKKTPGGAGTHTGHTGHADAQRHTDHTDEPHTIQTQFQQHTPSTSARRPKPRPTHRYYGTVTARSEYTPCCIPLPVKSHRGEPPGHTPVKRRSRGQGKLKLCGLVKKNVLDSAGVRGGAADSGLPSQARRGPCAALVHARYGRHVKLKTSCIARGLTRPGPRPVRRQRSPRAVPLSASRPHPIAFGTSSDKFTLHIC